MTTAVWTEPALATARRFAALGRPPYRYHFRRLPPGALESGDRVKHTAELRYVFGTLTDDGAYDAVDRRVSEDVQEAWISFARTGVPRTDDGAAWPRYDPADPRIAMIDDVVSIEPHPVDPVDALVNACRTGGPWEPAGPLRHQK